MNISIFIKEVLIDQISELLKNPRFHYISFSLISQGIEVLGACLDSRNLFKEGKSRQRFYRAIRELFPISYQPYIIKKGKPFDLYDNLRCGLSHVLLPKNEIELIQNAEKIKFGANHLELKKIRGNQRLVLISEDLYSDFKKASETVLYRIENGQLSQPKHIRELLSFDP